jgi:hypothetical protein
MPAALLELEWVANPYPLAEIAYMAAVLSSPVALVCLPKWDAPFSLTRNSCYLYSYLTLEDFRQSLFWGNTFECHSFMRLHRYAQLSPVT